MKPVTIWYSRYGKEKDVKYEFNHIEDGHTDATKPRAMSPEQDKLWKGGDWTFKLACLNDNAKVVEC